MHVPYNNIAKYLLCQAPVCIYLSLSIYLSLTFLFQSPMQVDNTNGLPASDTLSPIPPPTFSALAVETIPISYFLVSLFSRSSLLVLTLINFLSLLLYLRPLLVLMAVLLRKVYFSFFSLFFFLTCFLQLALFFTLLFCKQIFHER